MKPMCSEVVSVGTHRAEFYVAVDFHCFLKFSAECGNFLVYTRCRL